MLFILKLLIIPRLSSTRKYVPEVSKLPSQYIYEPWKAPKDVQESCGCIVGSDYPQPVKDHKSSKLECLHNMQNLYKELVTAGTEQAVLQLFIVGPMFLFQFLFCTRF